ncbi:MAG: helix-turn-helix domain-containing GNAT family N-acetyltransferase [Planctomycetota bacterium]
MRSAVTSSPPVAVPAPRIEALRAFSRFYTQRLGMLGQHLLASRFTLPEARVLWELAHADGATASALARALDLDAGYLSRLLRRLSELGLVKARRAPRDGRQTLLALSAAGRRAFAPLDRASQRQMQDLLAPLPDSAQRELLASTGRVRALLDSAAPSPFVLRRHGAGDIGWIVQRHGALYWQEYRWDDRFEALVARIGADFIERLDPAREACWIAERDDVPLGCVCLVRARDERTQRVRPGVAQLRLLLVEPAARGQGIGKALTAECERFARAAGYRRIRLWTNSVLLAARGIYAAAGYRLVASEPHHSFGHDLVGETWELSLA